MKPPKQDNFDWVPAAFFLVLAVVFLGYVFYVEWMIASLPHGGF
jgi:hypothetical protein